ncbi:cysteine hydrolase family protein [Nocardioides sp. WG-D5]
MMLTRSTTASPLRPSPPNESIASPIGCPRSGDIRPVVPRCGRETGRATWWSGCCPQTRLRRRLRPSQPLRPADDCLKPSPEEPVVTKVPHNASTTTNLQQVLAQNGVTEVVISGIRTEHCCKTTTRIPPTSGTTSCSSAMRPQSTPLPHWTLPVDASLEQILSDPQTLSPRGRD